jgi:hypothetical protein
MLLDENRPNPHKSLPVYATIHKIRRLVIASIGRNRENPELLDRWLSLVI